MRGQYSMRSSVFAVFPLVCLQDSFPVVYLQSFPSCGQSPRFLPRNVSFLPVDNHILLWIHSPADGNAFWLGWINCCGTQVETLCGQMFSVLLGVCLGMELPGGKVKSCICLCEESVVFVQSVCKAFTTGAGRTGTVYCFGEDRCSSGWPWRWPDLEFLLLLLDAKITVLYPGALSLKKKKSSIYLASMLATFMSAWHNRVIWGGDANWEKGLLRSSCKAFS